MNTFTRILPVFASALIIFCCSCKKGNLDEQPSGSTPEITQGVDVSLPADSGEVGLVINAREFFRKGYTATKAEVKFTGYPEFNDTLDIDPYTNVAVLSIPNEKLTDDQRRAFKTGVPVDIAIYGKGLHGGNQTNEEQTLENYHSDNQVVDDSNMPLDILTDREPYVPPVILKEGISYYIQPKEIGGKLTPWKNEPGRILQSFSSTQYTFSVPDNTSDPDFVYRFYVKPTGDSDSSYFIIRATNDDHYTPTWYFHELNNAGAVTVVNKEEGSLKFKLIPDAEGWVQIREVSSGKYLNIDEGSATPDEYRALKLHDGFGSRFRFISADIQWFAADKGTKFSPSVIPPAEIEFAYASTIKNCSSAKMTTQVGNEKSRSSVQSLETTESLQFFSGGTATASLKTSASVGVSIPAVGDVSASVEINYGLELTTSLTKSQENKVNTEVANTSSVSRTRTLEIPNFTGVKVYDAVRVVKNARVPFTQTVRLTAKYKDETPLTGNEIRTQMLFNFVEALPLDIGPNYVDVGVSGFVKINEMFNTETSVDEIPNACN